jgi:hypothetical protein
MTHAKRTCFATVPRVVSITPGPRAPWPLRRWTSTFWICSSRFVRLQSFSFRLPWRPAVLTQVRCRQTRLREGRLPTAPITNDRLPRKWEQTRPGPGRSQMLESVSLPHGHRFTWPVLLTSIPAEGNRCAGHVTPPWAFGESCPFGRVSARARWSTDRRDSTGSARWAVQFASRALAPLWIASARSLRSSMVESIKPQKIPVAISGRHLTSPLPTGPRPRVHAANSRPRGRLVHTEFLRRTTPIPMKPRLCAPHYRPYPAGTPRQRTCRL